MSGSSHYVIVSQQFPPEKGGNASRIHDTVTNLVDEETRVTVLAPPACYPPGNFERTWDRRTTHSVGGVVVHRLWSWQPQVENPGLLRRFPYYLLFAVHAFLWLLVNGRSYDVVVTSTPPITTGIPGFAAAVLGKSWVVDVRDLWIENSVALGYVDENSPLVTASRFFQSLVLSTADRITVTTKTLGSAVSETYGEELQHRTRHIPNGVEVDVFSPQETSPSTDGGTESCQVIVYTGNIGSAQALEPCIRAMDQISNDEAVLRLVGDGDDVSRLEELTERLGLSDRIEFVGLVDRDEVPTEINDADVGLAPIKASDELAYAMPTKTYEYLACQVPVVVTGSGEIERFVEESGGGIHADTDPGSIAAALDRLLDDPTERARMGERGYRHVVKTYDRKAIADRFGEVLASLSGGDQEPADTVEVTTND